MTSVDPPTYTIFLLSTGGNRLDVMRELRSLREDLTLKSVKALIADPPQPVLHGVSYWDVDRIMNRLHSTGGLFSFRKNRWAEPSPPGQGSS